jgi:hypothetical protein
MICLPCKNAPRIPRRIAVWGLSFQKLLRRPWKAFNVFLKNVLIDPHWAPWTFRPRIIVPCSATFNFFPTNAMSEQGILVRDMVVEYT